MTGTSIPASFASGESGVSEEPSASGADDDSADQPVNIDLNLLQNVYGGNFDMIFDNLI